MQFFKVFWYDSTRGMNRRSTDYKADALTTTPLRRLQLQKCFNVAAFNDYKKYCNCLNRVTKTAKQNYYNEAIEANKNNQDQMWKVVKCLVQLKSKTKTLPTDLKAGDKGLLNDQEVICNQFNHYFANIGKKLV